MAWQSSPLVDVACCPTNPIRVSTVMQLRSDSSFGPPQRGQQPSADMSS